MWRGIPTNLGTDEIKIFYRYFLKALDFWILPDFGVRFWDSCSFVCYPSIPVFQYLFVALSATYSTMVLWRPFCNLSATVLSQTLSIAMRGLFARACGQLASGGFLKHPGIRIYCMWFQFLECTVNAVRCCNVANPKYVRANWKSIVITEISRGNWCETGWEGPWLSVDWFVIICGLLSYCRNLQGFQADFRRFKFSGAAIKHWTDHPHTFHLETLQLSKTFSKFIYSFWPW